MAVAAILATLAVAATAPPPPPATQWPFSPPECGYSVVFPSQPDLTPTAADDGSKNVAADLVSGGSRLDALCMRAAEDLGPGTAPQPDSAASLARIEEITKALAVQDAELRPLAALGPGCGEVRGFLDSARGRYQIAARLCVTSNSTFIVEAIYSVQQPDPAAAQFLETMRPK
jgi:hypothetical protein